MNGWSSHLGGGWDDEPAWLYEVTWEWEPLPGQRYPGDPGRRRRAVHVPVYEAARGEDVHGVGVAPVGPPPSWAEPDEQPPVRYGHTPVQDRAHAEPPDQPPADRARAEPSWNQPVPLPERLPDGRPGPDHRPAGVPLPQSPVPRQPSGPPGAPFSPRLSQSPPPGSSVGPRPATPSAPPSPMSPPRPVSPFEQTRPIPQELRPQFRGAPPPRQEKPPPFYGPAQQTLRDVRPGSSRAGQPADEPSAEPHGYRQHPAQSGPRRPPSTEPQPQRRPPGDPGGEHAGPYRPGPRQGADGGSWPGGRAGRAPVPGRPAGQMPSRSGPGPHPAPAAYPAGEPFAGPHWADRPPQPDPAPRRDGRPMPPGPRPMSGADPVYPASGGRGPGYGSGAGEQMTPYRSGPGNQPPVRRDDRSGVYRDDHAGARGTEVSGGYGGVRPVPDPRPVSSPRPVSDGRPVSGGGRPAPNPRPVSDGRPMSGGGRPVPDPRPMAGIRPVTPEMPPGPRPPRWETPEVYRQARPAPDETASIPAPGSQPRELTALPVSGAADTWLVMPPVDDRPAAAPDETDPRMALPSGAGTTDTRIGWPSGTDASDTRIGRLSDAGTTEARTERASGVDVTDVRLGWLGAADETDPRMQRPEASGWASPGADPAVTLAGPVEADEPVTAPPAMVDGSTADETEVAGETQPASETQPAAEAGPEQAPEDGAEAGDAHGLGWRLKMFGLGAVTTKPEDQAGAEAEAAETAAPAAEQSGPVKPNWFQPAVDAEADESTEEHGEEPADVAAEQQAERGVVAEAEAEAQPLTETSAEPAEPRPEREVAEPEPEGTAQPEAEPEQEAGPEALAGPEETGQREAPPERSPGSPARNGGDQRNHPASRLVDPEQVLAAYPWHLSPGTLREVVGDPDPLLAVRDRLTDKLEYAERDAVRARLLSLRAVVSRVLGDLDFALADAREAVRHAAATGELRRTAIVQARLANVLRWRGEFAEADRLFEEADSVELPGRLRAEIAELAGRSAFEQGRYLEAVNRFEQALDLRRGGDDEMVARIAAALDSVAARAAERGWGPYPRPSAEIRQRLEPATLPAGDRWAEVQPFHERVAWVRRADSLAWQLVGANGEPLIDESSGYLQVRPFADGLAWVSRDPMGGFSAIDRGNRVIVPGGFDDVLPFRHGVAPVRRGAGWGAVDRYGRVVIPPKYRRYATALPGGHAVDGFTAEGLAVIDAGDRYGVIDHTGQLRVAPVHAAVVIHPVAYLVRDRNGRWGALGRDGEPLVDVVHGNEDDVMNAVDEMLADTRPVL